MKTIRRYYTSLTLAERYQGMLCERFDYVRLVDAPRFSFAGWYIWQVR